MATFDDAMKDFLEGIVDPAKLSEAAVACGEAFVENCVRTGAYQNRTGNLRSSVGAVTTANGKVGHPIGFRVVLGGADGASKGKSLAIEEAQKVAGSGKFTVTCVVGMEYAEYVERKGYNVYSQALLDVDFDSIIQKKLGKQ